MYLLRDGMQLGEDVQVRQRSHTIDVLQRESTTCSLPSNQEHNPSLHYLGHTASELQLDGTLRPIKQWAWSKQSAVGKDQVDL